MKIGVVGAGQVGATAAYAMTMRGVGSEIVLVDRNADLAVAQAHDILDATPWSYPVRVRAGETADLDGAGIVVLAAGASQKPGESRLDLLSRNAEIFAEIVPAVLAAAPNTIFLVASNPVDIMTQIVTILAARHGVPPRRVIGSGTIIELGAVPHAARRTSADQPGIHRCACARRTWRQRGVALVGRRGRRHVGGGGRPPDGAGTGGGRPQPH